MEFVIETVGESEASIQAPSSGVPVFPKSLKVESLTVTEDSYVSKPVTDEERVAFTKDTTED